jgi:hypothetical protein
MSEKMAIRIHGRRRRNLAGLLVALGSAVAFTGPAAAAEASPVTAEAHAGILFASEQFPYTVVLPPGWDILLEEPGSGEDLFEGPEGTARIGGGPGEPATAEERVAINRADLVDEAQGCLSDPADDRPTTLGGEHAVSWWWSCPGSYHAAINTVVDGLRLRVQVNVPEGSETLAPPLLERLRQGFAFTSGAGPVDPSADLAAIEAALEGTYETAWHPSELQVATIDAAGLVASDDWVASVRSAERRRLAVKFQNGAMIQYEAADGGPLEVAWTGTYQLLDDHTIEASEVGLFNRFVYDFTLRDDILTLDVISVDDPYADAFGVQTAIYETLPFTRVP